MKTAKNRICLLLAMLTLFCSCRKNADPASGTAPGNSKSVSEVSDPRILTNVYQGEKFPLPEGEEMERFVFPQWDGETLWYVSVRYIHKKDAEGNSTVRREWSLVQSSRTEVLTRIPLALPDGAVMPGMIRDEELSAMGHRCPDEFLDVDLIRAPFNREDADQQVCKHIFWRG